MAKQVVLNSKAKAEQNKKNRHGKKWDQGDDFILAIWDKYLSGKITAKFLLSIFPGRSFKAIESKVYRIRGREEKKRDKNPDQTEMAFWELEDKK